MASSNDIFKEVDPMATISTPMTEEEFLALPDDDGVERALIRGELREWSTERSRGFAHGAVLGCLAYHLTDWRDRQPKPRGFVVSGMAGVRLRTNPSTLVGVDLAYFGPRSKPENPRKARFVDGPPILAVEILSPSDEHEDIAAKIGEYLDAGVSLVWIVDTRFSTVTVHRPDAKPRLFNVDQEIAAEPFLPGFRVAVATFFEDIEG